eukprot:scaffold40910_cov72-Phaeocystis_antarctica.AAC.3
MAKAATRDQRRHVDVDADVAAGGQLGLEAVVSEVAQANSERLGRCLDEEEPRAAHRATEPGTVHRPVGPKFKHHRTRRQQRQHLAKQALLRALVHTKIGLEHLGEAAVVGPAQHLDAIVQHHPGIDAARHEEIVRVRHDVDVPFGKRHALDICVSPQARERTRVIPAGLFVQTRGQAVARRRQGCYECARAQRPRLCPRREAVIAVKARIDQAAAPWDLYAICVGAMRRRPTGEAGHVQARRGMRPKLIAKVSRVAQVPVAVVHKLGPQIGLGALDRHER